jgi:hypothetical protein
VGGPQRGPHQLRLPLQRPRLRHAALLAQRHCLGKGGRQGELNPRTHLVMRPSLFPFPLWDGSNQFNLQNSGHCFHWAFLFLLPLPVQRGLSVEVAALVHSMCKVVRSPPPLPHRKPLSRNLCNSILSFDSCCVYLLLVRFPCVSEVKRRVLDMVTTLSMPKLMRVCSVSLSIFWSDRQRVCHIGSTDGGLMWCW